jgi:DNA topoisomerase-1
LEDREAGEDDDQKKLYALIWTRAVASQLADAEYSVNTLSLEAQQGDRTFVFKATGRTLTAPGWRVLTATDAAEDAEQQTAEEKEAQGDDNGKVPALPVGTAVSSTSTRVLNKQTKPPNGYTQASLIKKLESEGIGRPSTYPAILKNIITRGYLNDAKKILVATDVAKLLIDSLTGRFAFVEYDYTRSLEQQLDDIASGKAGYHAVVSALDTKLRSELGELHIQAQPALAGQRAAGGGDGAASGIPCPKCKKGHLRKPNGRDFFSCNQYREGCTFSVNCTVAKKKLTDKQIETLCTKGETGVIKGFINKQDKPFEAVLTCNEGTNWRTTFKFTK